jgi:hypothetical protein
MIAISISIPLLFATISQVRRLARTCNPNPNESRERGDMNMINYKTDPGVGLASLYRQQHSACRESSCQVWGLEDEKTLVQLGKLERANGRISSRSVREEIINRARNGEKPVASRLKFEQNTAGKIKLRQTKTMMDYKNAAAVKNPESKSNLPAFISDRKLILMFNFPQADYRRVLKMNIGLMPANGLAKTKSSI